MKKYEVHFERWHSMKEEIGEDFVFFDCIVSAVDTPAGKFPVSLPYRMIEQQVEETIPAGSSIIQQIRKRVTGWGLKESQYVKELVECGIDVAVMAKIAVERHIDLEKEELRWQNIEQVTSPANEMMDELHASVAAMKENSDRYYLLCSGIEKAITAEVIKLFPVLLESSPGCIMKLEDILAHHIPDLAEDLNDLVLEAESNRK